MPALHRMTISIPPELKAEMDSVPQSAQVNWSRLACGAFRQWLDDNRRKQKGESTLNANVLARLRKSKESGEAVDFQNGKKAGRSFAEDHADYHALVALDRLLTPDRRSPREEPMEWVAGDFMAPDNAFTLTAEALGFNEGERGLMAEWMGVDDDQGMSNALLAGFIAGCLSVYDAFEAASGH